MHTRVSCSAHACSRARARALERLSSFSFSSTATPSRRCRHLSRAALSTLVRVQSVYARERTMFLSRPLPRRCIFSHVCIRCIGRRSERGGEKERKRKKDRWMVTCRSGVYTHPPRVLAHLNSLFFSHEAPPHSLILRNVSRL